MSLLAGCGGADGGTLTGDGRNPATPAPGPLPAEELKALTFGPMCAQFPEGTHSGGFTSLRERPVASALATSVFTRRLSVALRTSGLAEQLDRMPEATVFAPYDAAFDELARSLGPQRAEALTADRNALADVLRNHVLDRRYDRAGLAGAGSVRTLGGGELRVVDNGQIIEVTDSSGGSTSHTLCGNVQTANATVYLIDRVLQRQPHALGRR